ncbi:Rab3 GTPase-activating protein catalytic subunit-domain-containing protein [Gamsiella multidivaricata]|uniref:Rab3 GTPase-activating protein catalytic subunit-domain-containing protein n=1 Tax=Gamsiella multidivaricata TaxID=101098 RepID=UPI00221F7F6A|nr:Rab3 GTPase-activating protein catalytic subunit-domain-containing protein [Gamsiella multidivaricata]KAG0366907.1 Rab3 GTPase-activating protein catalytic subunit [Gamsiella multidivaricata]KAI7817249.1 Rab3 GTPase-activating protein catalytic subunit-domain-containing protein [Gamsiella multidivaricata]
METDDFDSFEFIDYTTSGPWERFIVQIENCLKHWGLVHGSYGVFNPSVMPTTEGAIDLDQELALALSEDQQNSDTVADQPVGASKAQPKSLSKVYQHSAPINLENTSYILSYQYHPAKARIAAGVERIDLDFLATSLERQNHHILHRWTGLTHILVLSPASDAISVIVDLGSAKLLLSSFAIAFQNTGCNIPVFVPTGHPKNRTYTGLSIQPQLPHARDSELGLEETAEDQAIEVRFNTVVVPYPPAQYTNLSGILELFIERMGIDDEFSTSGEDLDGSGGYSQEVKEQIHVSGLFSYQLSRWPDNNWREWSGATEADLQSADDSRVTSPTLPFGPVNDPLKSLQLVARFASAPSTVYLDSKNLTDMDASRANIWLMKPLFKSDDYGLLSGILEDIISSWSMEISSNSEAGDKDRSSDRDQRSYSSLLRKGARLIQGSIAMVDAVDVENIVQALFTAGSPLSAPPSTTSKRKDQRRGSGPCVDRVVSAAELGLHFRHATTVPCGSFLWKMLQHLIDVVAPNSHVSYPISFMRFLKAAWTDLLKQFAEHWEKKEMIPLIQVLPEPVIDQREGDQSAILDEDQRSRKMESKVPAIDLRFNILHQKLSMLNCCIARENAERQEGVSDSSPAADISSSMFSAISSPTSSKSTINTAPNPALLVEVPSGPVTNTGTSVDAKSDSSKQDYNITQASTLSKEAVDEPGHSVDDLAEVTQNLMDHKTGTFLEPVKDMNSSQSTGPQSEAFKGLVLLETGAPLVVPRLQDAGYMTEDMIQEQEEIFESLGSSTDAAKTRAQMQSAQLSSDMSAFKAANPGCVLGDFIRWHSPKDWDDEKQQMSTRMADSGNFWQKLWEKSEPLPARQQKPLFDHHQEATKVLAYLNSLTTCQVFVHLLPTVFLLAYDTLVSHPVSRVSQTVAKALQGLAQDLTDFPWNELSLSEKDLDLKPIIAKFKAAELVMGHFITLEQKLSEQYGLVERILEETESVVEDGSERDCVYKLFSVGGSGQSNFPKPTCREFVIETFDPSWASSSGSGVPTFVSSGDMTGWHTRPLQRRMYACFKDSEVRIVEAIAKDGMFM